MKNNKRALLVDLKERLGCTEEECLIINDIIPITFKTLKKLLFSKAQAVTVEHTNPIIKP